MKYKYSKIFDQDVAIIQPDVFYDFRGEYIETWNIESYKDIPNEEVLFKQDDISTSIKHTLRGFHGDSKTWKLIQCVYGALYQVIVDNRPESENYLKWEAFSLSDTAVFSYKQSTLYEGQGVQFTLMWDDPKVGAYWPIQNPILSERDAKAKYL